MGFSATAAASQLEDSDAIVDTVEDLAGITEGAGRRQIRRVLAVELDATSPGESIDGGKILGKMLREDVAPA